MFSEAIIMLVIFMSMFRFSGLTKFNMVLILSSLLPSFVFIAFTIPHIDPHTWTESHGIYNCSDSDNATDSEWYTGDGMCQVSALWGSILSYSLWAWCGFFNIGTLAGEVANPHKMFPQALMILIPIVFVQTVLPLALSISIDTNLNNYEPGNYSRISDTLTGRWLGAMITCGAVISQTGMSNGAALISHEALQSFLLRHKKPFFARRAKSDRAIVRWLFDHQFRVAPIIGLFNGVLLILFVLIPYELLITASMLVFNTSVLAFLSSYVRLKYRSPERDWIYGKSWKWALLISLLPTSGSIAMSVFTIIDDYELFGVPRINLVSYVTLIGLGLLLHGGFILTREAISRSRSHSRRNSQSFASSETMSLLSFK